MEVGRTGAPGLVVELVDVAVVGVAVDDVCVVVAIVVVEVWVCEEELELVVLVEVLTDEDGMTVMVTTTVVGDPSAVEVSVLVRVTTVAVVVDLCTPEIASISKSASMLHQAPRCLQPMLAHT